MTTDEFFDWAVARGFRAHVFYDVSLKKFCARIDSTIGDVDTCAATSAPTCAEAIKKLVERLS